MSVRAAALLLVLLAACSTPAHRPPQLPNARAELQLTAETTSGRDALRLRVREVDGQLVQGEAISLPPGEHSIRVRIWVAGLGGTDRPYYSATLHGWLADGHRYELQAEWTPKETMSVRLVDQADGHVVTAVDARVEGGGA